jgi:hypothetical protein
MVISLQDVPVTVPRSVVEVPQRTLSPTFKSRDWSPVIGSICRSQTPHREFDLPVWQLSPMLHNGHVTALRKLTKNLASLEASRFYGEPECFAQKCTIRLALFGHALGNIAWSIGHSLTPDSHSLTPKQSHNPDTGLVK